MKRHMTDEEIDKSFDRLCTFVTVFCALFIVGICWYAVSVYMEDPW